MFIREALVARQIRDRAPFLRAQPAARRGGRGARAQVAPARRAGGRGDDLSRFTTSIVPADIYNGAGFEQWRRGCRARESEAAVHDARVPDAARARRASPTSSFRNSSSVAGVQLKLRYRFEPAHPLDGVTVTVPLALLNQLDAAAFEWLVPGLIREKVGAYLKALPKAIRKQLLPLQEQVTRFLEEQDNALVGDRVVAGCVGALRQNAHR